MHKRNNKEEGLLSIFLPFPRPNGVPRKEYVIIVQFQGLFTIFSLHYEYYEHYAKSLEGEQESVLEQGAAADEESEEGGT